MKNGIFITIITLVIIALIIVFVLIIKNYNNNQTNNIQLNTSMWITPLTKYNIGNTKDTFEITNEVKLPQYQDGGTSSWKKTINYKITSNGTEYAGNIIFDSDYGITYNEDSNPNYKVISNNFKDNSVFIQILKK